MNNVQTIYYKGRKGTTMKVNSFDIPYWAKQGWTTSIATSHSNKSINRNVINRNNNGRNLAIRHTTPSYKHTTPLYKQTTSQINALYKKYFDRNANSNEINFWKTQNSSLLENQLRNDYKKASGINYDNSPIRPGQTKTNNQLLAIQRKIASQKKAEEQKKANKKRIFDIFNKYNYTPSSADINYWSNPNKTNEYGNLEQNLQRRKEQEQRSILPVVKIPDKIATKVLEKEPNDAIKNIITEAKINQDYLDKVKNTYEKYGANAQANKEFVIGASRAASVAPDLSLVGQPLGQVMEKLGLNKHLDNLGVQPLTSTQQLNNNETVNKEIPNGYEKIPNPNLIKNYTDIHPDKTNTFLYGKPVTTAATITANKEPKTIGSAINNMYDTLIAKKQAGMAKEIDMTNIETKKNEAEIAVEKARQAIADKKIIDAATLEKISKDQPIPMTLIRRQQNKYSSDQYITNLKMAQDYNNKLILSKMAENNFLEAQRINKSIANDNYEIQKLQLSKLEAEKEIKPDESNRMEKELNYERQLALDGYSYIPSTDIYNNIVRKYNITPSNFSNFIYKDPITNKLYLKNIKSTQKSQIVKVGKNAYNVIIDSNGNIVKKELIGSSDVNNGGKNNTNNVVLKPEDKVNIFFSKVKGSDLKVSPKDWLKAKEAWIKDGYSPTSFDSKFKGWKNPNNYYYK